MKTTTEKNIIVVLKIVTVICILCILYMVFIYIPTTRNENKIKLIKSQYNFCLKNAELTYNKTWDNECNSRGREKGCMLPAYSATSKDETLKNDENKCLELYKIDLKINE